MEESKPSLGLFFISASLLFFAAVLTFLSFQQYKNIKPVIPDGSTVGDIPVAGLDAEEAAERVKSVYGLPTEIIYRGSRIHLEIPDSVNYDLLQQKLDEQIDQFPVLPVSQGLFQI